MFRSEIPLWRRTRALCVLAVCAVTVSTPLLAATETVFPKKSRLLKVERPAHCQQWQAPLPDRQTNVVFPDDASGIKGDAALLVRISANGEYLGMTDFAASDEAYAKAAQASIQNWTFKPAVCNGESIASDARVDFEFRREGGISYTTGSAFGRR